MKRKKEGNGFRYKGWCPRYIRQKEEKGHRSDQEKADQDDFKQEESKETVISSGQEASAPQKTCPVSTRNHRRTGVQRRIQRRLQRRVRSRIRRWT